MLALCGRGMGTLEASLIEQLRDLLKEEVRKEYAGSQGQVAAGADRTGSNLRK